MANTTGTLNGTIVAQRTLDTLLLMFPVITQISNNFSDQGGKFGQTVDVKLVTAGTASDYDLTNGYVASDRAQVDIPVVINKHKHHTYSVNDQERSSTDLKLIDMWAATGAYTLGRAMMDDIVAMMTIANYGGASNANTIIVTSSSFDRTKVLDIRAGLNIRGVPDVNRYMVLNSAYAESLFKDTSIVANYASQVTNSVSPKLPNIHGFDPSEYAVITSPTSIAPSGASATSENLVGWAGTPDGICIAARVPTPPEAPVPGRISTVSDKNTGLALQLREWYDMKLGKEFRTYTFMYGVSPGNTATVTRIQSATQTVGS